MQSILLAVLTALSTPPPNPIIDAQLTLVNSTQNGKLYKTSQDGREIPILHVWGTAREQGRAQGLLLAEQIHQFMIVDMDQYYTTIPDQVPMGDLPEWLQNAIKNAVGPEVPAVINTALEYVYLRQYEYLATSPSEPLEEMAGIAEGMCESGKIPNCDLKSITKSVHYTNMLPELIRMSCSMTGAWGSATPTGKLTQHRSLDFGLGPFANNQVVVTHHFDALSESHDFTAMSFPGLVGAVTGFSENIGLSEKVWDIAGGGTPSGTYDGMPVVGVIRNILQFVTSKDEAYAYTSRLPRTWGVWLGVGDVSSQQFRALQYQMSEVKSYDYMNISQATNGTEIDHVVYVDRHPQPSHDPAMYNALKMFPGNLTGLNIAQNVPRLTRSGDVHLAVFDFAEEQVYMGFGLTNANWTSYGVDDAGMACYRPLLRFSMPSFWSEKRPTA
ncbi:Protein dcd1B [Diplonema papillatum]|nr:Protein dcd1B [Diplonema papillatum]|eukprot:gene9335-14472_t